MAVPFKPHSIVLHNISDDGSTELATTPQDGTTATLTGMAYPISAEVALRTYGIEIEGAYEFICELHATAINTPRGGTFPVRDGQRFVWNSRNHIVAADPVEYRHGLGADHMTFAFTHDKSING